MATWLVIFFYSLFLVIAVYNLVTQYKRKKKINAFIFFHAAFILYYIFIPIISHICIDLNSDGLESFVLWISLADSYDIFYAFSYTVIAYTVFIFVYRISFASKTRLSHEITEKTNTENNNKHESHIIQENKKVYKFAVLTGISTLAIGVFAELLIANSLGGILTALAMGDQLRAYGSDSSVLIPQNRLFAIVLMVSSLASTYFLAYALRIKRSFIVQMFLLISILASIFYLLINAGRLGVILFGLTFFIDYAFRKSKYPFIYMFVYSIFGFILLGLLDDLFFYLSYGYLKESSSDLGSIINEFAFPYLNLLNVHHINDAFGLRMGVDYFTWIINIIPTSILSIFGLTKVTSGYHFITEYYIETNSGGGIPTDLLTLGIRQFGFIGILIISTTIAIICKELDKVIDKLHSDKFYFITLRIALILFIIVPYADLDSFVRNRYDMIMVLIFAVIVNFIKTKSKRHYPSGNTR
ncbi:O-antigen polymerase [Peribacillus sp. NPDC096379]|uniref:O-antigen polymerase n=1 Tax=Peribacillus sp. NPDC096379 TaxID=3364393 RepID=UPI0037F264F2